MKYIIRYYQAKPLSSFDHHEAVINQHGWGYGTNTTGHLAYHSTKSVIYEDLNAAYQRINEWPVKQLLGTSGLYYLVEEYP